jgi:hypothetical protein
VELLCGRGNGLEALAQLGFLRIEGVDLSPRLLRQYKGFARATLRIADSYLLPIIARISSSSREDFII